jgi:hypothetical protein
MEIERKGKWGGGYKWMFLGKNMTSETRGTVRKKSVRKRKDQIYTKGAKIKKKQVRS